MTTDTDALLATVREALELASHANHRDWSPIEIEQAAGRATPALDSLAAELRDGKEHEAFLEQKWGEDCERLNEARAELERVKAERDVCIGAHRGLEVTFDAVQARLDKALSALREAYPVSDNPARQIIRAAIAEIEG